MQGIPIIILFCLQLVSFFLIILLYTKLNKLKELEKKQQQATEELDNALSIYLLEMKEENERFIKELSSISKQPKTATEQTNQVATQPSITNFITPTSAKNVYKSNIEKHTVIEEDLESSNQETKLNINEQFAPKQEQGQAILYEELPSEIEETLTVKELSFEEMVIEMYQSGQFIEDIAKKLNKGKTEIELLIKFHK